MYLKPPNSSLNKTTLKSLKISYFLHQSFNFYHILSRFSTSSLANISDSQPTSLSTSLYTFLPHTQNPNNIVNIICSNFKILKKRPNFSVLENDIKVLENDLKGVISHLGTQEITRVLLRCQSDSYTALCFFNWVRNDLCISPNVHNYCVLVHILVWSKNFSKAMALLLEVIELSRSVSGGSDVFKVLVLSTNECSWEPVVFEMLVKAYVKKGMVREGFSVFRRMVRFGLVPSVVTVNCLLTGLSKFNYVDRCWYLFEEMGRIGVRANCFTFNILTHVLCKGEDVNKVNKFLDEMEEKGFIPDVVTYNTLIDSYCKKRRLKEAIYLFNIMYRRGVLPDLVTYTALVNGYCKDMNMREAHKLFHRMIQEGLCPDVTSYNTLICGYCREGMMHEARTLLRDMIGNGVLPDNFCCWILVKGYEKQDRLLSALNLLVELQRFNVLIPKDIYNYLIVALCKDNRALAAKNLLDRMSTDGHETTEKIFNEIVNCLYQLEMQKVNP
ncbi:uncharacterized protein LOC141683292 [Apium graveolens]|uniref:uncharacterized protein LOC141683292 n=1 Tax=Apium graveolens TaxID=4045 RepID=UPI003D7C0828